MNQPNLRDPEQWIPRDLFADYCGERADKLLAYYDKAKAKRQMIGVDLDWFALLLLPAWLGYRQQWTLWATLTGCFAAVSVFEALLHVELPRGAFGGIGIALGLMAHGFLLSNAHGLYLKLKKQGLAEETIRAMIKGRARPRTGLAFLALFGSLLVGIVSAMFSLQDYP